MENWLLLNNFDWNNVNKEKPLIVSFAQNNLWRLAKALNFNFPLIHKTKA
jgi:hypothetical protein